MWRTIITKLASFYTTEWYSIIGFANYTHSIKPLSAGVKFMTTISAVDLQELLIYSRKYQY